MQKVHTFLAVSSFTAAGPQAPWHLAYLYILYLGIKQSSLFLTPIFEFLLIEIGE